MKSTSPGFYPVQKWTDALRGILEGSLELKGPLAEHNIAAEKIRVLLDGDGSGNKGKTAGELLMGAVAKRFSVSGGGLETGPTEELVPLVVGMKG